MSHTSSSSKESTTEGWSPCWGPAVKIGPVTIPLFVMVLVVFGALVGGVGGYYLYLTGIFEREIESRVRATEVAKPTAAPLPTYTPYPTAAPLPTHTPYPTRAPCPTNIPCPTSTPILYIAIDPMEATADWIQYTDDKGSTMVIGQVDGKTNKAVQLSYALKEWGYVGITRLLIPCELFGTRGIRFSYRGTGAPNSVEVKLIYTPDGRGREAVFSVIRNRATDTNGKWVLFEALYSEFKCWPDTGCSATNPLDISKVQKIDFAISNKRDLGDVAGVGAVLIDDVQAFK